MSAQDIDKVVQRVRQALDELQEQENILTKVGVDRDAGIVKVYGERSDALKKASAGLAEILELAYTTAEHHPYWGILYHATEISKIILEKWDDDLTADNRSEVSWRCDEIKTALERAKHHDQ